MTGSGVVGAGSGVHTFKLRQFSSLVVAYAMVDGSICGQMGPRAVAFSVVVQAAAGWGGFQRLAPPVVAAKGMPRNDRTPPAVLPWTIPLSVGTSRLEAAASGEPASTSGPPSLPPPGFAPELEELHAPKQNTARPRVNEEENELIGRSVVLAPPSARHFEREDARGTPPLLPRRMSLVASLVGAQ